VRWQVRPQCRDLLFGPDGLRLEEWLQTGRAHVVKHGPHRTVYRVVLPELSFYLKHYRLADVRAWLRQLVRPAKARIEFDCALAVAARQVPTVSPLAVGESGQGNGPGESYLITRSLEHSEPVSSLVENTLPHLPLPGQARLRQGLARALGEFVAHLHDAGIVHRDLHAANILAQLGEDGQYALHLIDLHAVDLGRPVDWTTSADNLVLLNRWFVLRAGRSDRLRFWFAYCRARFGAGASKKSVHLPNFRWRDTARSVETQTWQSNLCFWRHRDARCLENNRHYQRLRQGSVAGCAGFDLDPDALSGLLTDPDAPFRVPGAKLLKDSRSSTVAEFELRVRGNVQPVIYKRFRVTSRVDAWLALVRQPPVVRSWMFGHGLRERYLTTARPLLLLYRRWGPLVYEGYLLTEKIQDALDLHQFVRSLETRPNVERRRCLRQRIDQVARLLDNLHRRQLSHRDLKAGNILLTRDAAWLIDLVGMKRWRRLAHRRRVQNLARLHASFHASALLTRTDKLRFLRTYLHWGLHGKQGWKDWWRRIAAATEAKVRRNRRSGRPLA
jgi:tRNA A-37 threonylcarbamoyl transferase component Bud32